MERSIFVLSANYPASPCCGTILKLDLNIEEHVELVAQFNHKPQSDPENYVGLHWSASLIDKDKLCLLPKWARLPRWYFGDCKDREFNKEEQAVTGYIYDIKANEVVELNAPMSDGSSGLVLSLQGQIYWVENLNVERMERRACFKKYNTPTRTWEALPPVPWRGTVMGHAVFDDFLVFSTCSEGLWVYDLSTKKWYLIWYETGDYAFEGVGTVLENNTLYALKNDDEGEAILQILSISVTRKTEDVDFTCSILFNINLPCSSLPFCGDFLVHLDNNVFLLLRIATLLQFNGIQPVEVVRFEVVEGKVINYTSTLTKIPLHYDGSFIPMYCFSLPAIESENIVEKRNGGNNFTLDLIRDTKLEPQMKKSRTEDLNDV